jgi:phosphoglycolate phosphatase
MALAKEYGLYVFDLDGTLVDTQLDIARALQKALGDAGFPQPGLKDVTGAIGGGARKALLRLTGLKDDELDPKLLENFAAIYEQMCHDNTSVYPGAEELLRRLRERGAKLALVAMKYRPPTHSILKHHGLFDLLDAVLSFDDIEKRKPDPDSLFMLQQRFGVPFEQILMVGDTLTDLEYAKAAGVDACAVTYGYGAPEDLKAAGPRYMISGFAEML